MGVVMIDVMTQWASQPWLPISVLIGATLIVVVEATRDSRSALWGDHFIEDLDE